MLIQPEKVNKCKYSAESEKMQASVEKKLSILIQYVINIFEIGMNIAVAN
jgi:hypothetical protein